MAKVGRWLEQHYVVAVYYTDPKERENGVSYLDSNGFPGTWYDAIYHDSEDDAKEATKTAKILGEAILNPLPLSSVLRPVHEQKD